MRLLASLFGNQASAWMRTSLYRTAAAAQAPSSIRDWYDLLAAYYNANDLYGTLRDQRVSTAVADETLRGIRSPSFRAVEFHVSHLWPGTLPDALPIDTEHEAIIEPVQQVWSWSNWSSRKQVAARWLAMYGDLFLKVVANDRGDRVYFQLLDPRDVTDFAKDERGFITSIRLDIPRADIGTGGAIERWTHVEHWDKATLLYRVWRVEGETATRSLDMLGSPAEVYDMRSFGVDFVPVVHAPFRDTGDLRGVGCFVPVLDKIDELNRVSTRLHRMAFRHVKNVWALKSNGTDASGRPLPAPTVQTTTVTNGDGTRSDVLLLGDDSMVRLPGNSDLASLVPNLNYDALLNVARDQLADIETDLPEIVWYRLAQEGADLSGRAILLKMAAAGARVGEARGNAESALVRADQMALTIGDHLGLWSVGTFDRGEYDHAFKPRDIFSLTDLDRAETHRARGQAAQAYTSAGVPLSLVLTDVMGKTDEEATALLQQAARDADAAVERAMMVTATADQSDDDEDNPEGNGNA